MQSVFTAVASLALSTPDTVRTQTPVCLVVPVRDIRL